MTDTGQEARDAMEHVNPGKVVVQTVTLPISQISDETSMSIRLANSERLLTTANARIAELERVVEYCKRTCERDHSSEGLTGLILGHIEAALTPQHSGQR